MNTAPYPWQLDAWKRLHAAREAGRLPHALLISGDEGVGKRHFVRQFAHSLLCTSPDTDQRACGSCRACRFLAGESHPDFRYLEPEAEGKPIKVEAVRDFAAWSVLTAQEGGLHITILQPADALNAAAANALLKTLEEPVGGNLILLISSRPAMLPATIRSRCQGLVLSLPSSTDAEKWLEAQRPGEPWPRLLRLAHGAPLAAMTLADIDALTVRDECFRRFEALCLGRADAASVAESWVGDSYRQIVRWFASWIGDITRMGLGAEVRQLENPDLAAALQPLVVKVDLRAMMRIQDRANLIARAGQNDNLNPQMQLEDLLLELLENLR